MPIVSEALLEIIPQLFGAKECRKRGLGSVVRRLRESIPENGAGPIVSERREALQLLENNCRLVCGLCEGKMP